MGSKEYTPGSPISIPSRADVDNMTLEEIQDSFDETFAAVRDAHKYLAELEFKLRRLSGGLVRKKDGKWKNVAAGLYKDLQKHKILVTVWRLFLSSANIP
jgi:hypothetical protein